MTEFKLRLKRGNFHSVIGDMITEYLHILPTDNTPEFILDPHGVIKIKGRGLFGTGSDNSVQVMHWLDSYIKNPAEITMVIIAFEYLNSYSTSILVNMLKKLSKVIIHKKKLVIQWFYEEDDDDLLERGEYVSSSFDIPITFIVTDDICSCC